MADHIWQMLMQCAAQRDIDHLRPATDAQQRHAAPDGAVDQREFQRVALSVVGHRLVGGRMRLLPIAFGADVAPAGDDKAVQPVQNSRRDLGIDGLGRKQRGDSARHVDPFDVDGGQKAGPHVPHPGLRLLQVGRQTEYRLGCTRSAYASRVKAVQSNAPFPNRSPRIERIEFGASCRVV